MKLLLKYIYKKTAPPSSGLALAISVFAFLSALCAITLSASRGGVAWFLAAFIAMGAIAQFVLRNGYRFVHACPYDLIPRLPFSQLYSELHPDAHKRHAWTQRGGSAPYLLNKGKFYLGAHQRNGMRFMNGPKGNRDIAAPKPENLVRVCCIGASTTGNYIMEGERSNSYPLEFERVLGDISGRQIEVNNCGMGGYTSADIFIRFALNVIEVQGGVKAHG